MTKLIEDRRLTYDERATFGTCPICFAEHGEWCDGDVGMALGLNVHGERPETARLLLRNRVLSQQVVYGMQGDGVHYETRRETLYDAEAVEQLARLINERGG